MPQRPDPLIPPEGLGLRSRRLAERLVQGSQRGGASQGFRDEFYVSGTCDAGTRWQLGAEKCAQPSTDIVYLGCAGEHVAPVELCEAHSKMADVSTMWCAPCEQRGMHCRPMAVIRREKI